MDNLQDFRVIVFFALFIFILTLENYYKQRVQAYSKQRLKSNLSLFILGILTMKIAFPFGIYAIIPQIKLKSFSFIKLSDLEFIPSLILTIIIFDLAIYLQHVLSHKIPFLWKFHLIHHSDDKMDSTTALRFHPVEILLSGIYKLSLIAIINPYPESYIIYEILLNSMAIFNHANIRLNARLDGILKVLIATPSFHAPHHNPDKKLTNSNYGNIFSIWDYLFKTYSKIHNDNFGINYKKLKNHQSPLELLTASFK